MRIALSLLLVTAGCTAGTLRPRAVSTLRDALSAPEAEARLAAIRAAERLDEESLFDPVTRLLADDDARVRAAAAGATVRGHPDAPRVLAESLDAGDPAARAIAVEALGRKVGKLALADLRPALEDPDGGVREAAVRAIGPIAEAADVARLVALARGDASGPVRARALAAIAPHASADPAAAAAIVAGLGDPYLGARLAAIDGLRSLPPRRDEPAPRPGVTLGPTLEYLRAAGPAAISVCAAAHDPVVREAAANAAGAGELETIRTLARDPEPAVRLAAARALMRAGRGDDARPILAEGLGLEDPWLRLQAAIDLARLGDPHPLDPFATDADPATRRAALAAYPHRGDVPAVWVAALDDPDALVRVTAAELILSQT